MLPPPSCGKLGAPHPKVRNGFVAPLASPILWVVGEGRHRWGAGGCTTAAPPFGYGLEEKKLKHY